MLVDVSCKSSPPAQLRPNRSWGELRKPEDRYDMFLGVGSVNRELATVRLHTMLLPVGSSSFLQHRPQGVLSQANTGVKAITGGVRIHEDDGPAPSADIVPDEKPADDES